jgi:hypothetical protein
MDGVKRSELIERVKIVGLPSPGRPLPWVTLEVFFVGNDDFGSIGCNLTPMLGPQFFYEKLKLVRSQPNVQDVFIEVAEVEEEEFAIWPFSERVYIYTDAPPEDVACWTAALRPDAIEEGFANGKPHCSPELRPGYRCYYVWWD